MNNNLVELLLILDASGSMGPKREDTIGGFNTFINEAKDDYPDKEVRVTVVSFSQAGSQKELYYREDINNIKELEREDYKTLGSTALYDTICMYVDKLGNEYDEMDEEEKPSKVLVSIVTDGKENDSREFRNPEEVKKRIKTQEEEFGWKFIYTGADEEGMLDAQNMGIQRGNTVSAQNTGAGMRGAMTSNNAAFKSYVNDEELDLQDNYQENLEAAKSESSD